MHAEYGSGEGSAVITLLACSLMDQQITIELRAGSRLHALYGTRTSVEHTTCNYGLAPEVQHIADQHGLRIAATDETGEVRAVERKDHPFFVGTLYQPQLRSRPRAPHPVFTGFVEAAARGSVRSAAASNQGREHT
jgi:CTP synthase (UTP-ammonia lyase)